MVRRNWKQAVSDWRWLGVVAAIAMVWAAGRWATSPQHGLPTPLKPITARGARALTRPIESIRVGERVLARNPELTDGERTAEPNWAQWVHVSLQMPLAAAADEAEAAPARSMKIELLRPEAWLLERMGYVAQLQDEPAQARVDDLPQSNSTSSTPVREIYQESARVAQWLRQQNIELLGRCIDLELAEMGAVGQAIITEIRPCPMISPGDGQVVTATFEHPPSTQVLEVRFGEDATESPALGVTENHPFWSVDAQRFVPIGELEIGQRVVTYQGEVKRIASKLPRSGPEKVYNLEVYGEHVYFVGEEGLLAHNNCDIGDLGEKGAKEWLKRRGYTEVMQIQNRSGHGIDIVARHRDGTLTFFEVKTSTGARAPDLTAAQKNQARFIRDKLNQAAGAGPWWRDTPTAVSSRAEDLVNELRGGTKYRRYVIEITNAGNSAAPTQFRILPWSP